MVLTRNSVRRLQTAAFHVIDSCLDEQPLLPTDLSDFAVCLASGALTEGDAPRGIIAVDATRAYHFAPEGHLFWFHERFPDSELGILVFWLPGRINVQ